MRSILFFSLLLILLSACSIQKNSNTSDTEGQRELKLVIPKASWEPIHFENINKRTKIASLPSLRNITLPKDDLEVRIWNGFGERFLQGLVVKRVDHQWSALYLAEGYSESPNSKPYKYQRVLQPPKSGWKECWKRLVDEGLLTLPDSSELKGEKNIRDGSSYVVELNQNGTYRTYMYSNPQVQDWNEAKQIIKIGRILSEEFGLQNFAIV